jgi:50S ribosomal subunit-associated GTPase HflX
MRESPTLHVINKIDLPAAWDLQAIPDSVQVSARTGQGLEDLCRRIVGLLVKEAPTSGAAVPFSEECCDRLRTLLG